MLAVYQASGGELPSEAEGPDSESHEITRPSATVHRKKAPGSARRGSSPAKFFARLSSTPLAGKAKSARPASARSRPALRPRSAQRPRYAPVLLSPDIQRCVKPILYPALTLSYPAV